MLLRTAPAQRTFLLWEGVSMYLDASTVAATLDVFGGLPAGSRLAFDVFLAPWLEGARAGRAAQRGVRMAYGEEFTCSMAVDASAEESARERLGAHGLSLVRSRFVGRPELPANGILEAEAGADADRPGPCRQPASSRSLPGFSAR